MKVAHAREIKAAFDGDPLCFGRTVLGRTRWSAQIEMRRNVDAHRRNLIHSANGVGKTHELGSIIVEWLTRNKHGRVICTGPTFQQVQGGLWQEVKAAYYEAERRGIPLGGRMLDSEWSLGTQWDAAVLAVDNISAIQGRRGKKVLIVVDEAQGIEDPELMTALESLLSAEESRIIASGNPLWPSGWFFDASRNPAWHVQRISGLDHPNVVSGETVFPGAITKLWVDEKRTEWGEDDPRYISRVLGEFPESASDQLITRPMLVGAQDGTGISGEPRRMGLDVARQGGDKSSATVLDETRRVIHQEIWREESLMATAGRAQQIAKTYNVAPHMVGVDVCGLGAGVVDRCRENNFKVTAVDFGAAPVGEWERLTGRDAKFKNRKAELHWVARILLEQRALCIPSDRHELWSDLCAPHYWYDGAGRVCIESKDDLKARIGRSPDRGDSLLMALGAGARRAMVYL